MKFINDKDTLDDVCEKSLMDYVTNNLRLKDKREVRIKWWARYKIIVHSTLNQHRSNVTTSMKKVFLGKYMLMTSLHSSFS